jgi:hypothetical protein
MYGLAVSMAVTYAIVKVTGLVTGFALQRSAQ